MIQHRKVQADVLRNRVRQTVLIRMSTLSVTALLRTEKIGTADGASWGSWEQARRQIELRRARRQRLDVPDSGGDQRTIAATGSGFRHLKQDCLPQCVIVDLQDRAHIVAGDLGRPAIAGAMIIAKRPAMIFHSDDIATIGQQAAGY
jgi:hypothetical protein